jgi:hypothetical protein
MSTSIVQEGNSRTRSDVPMASIIIDDLVLLTAPLGIGVNFQCKYDTLITVKSEDYAVKKVSASGSHTAIGDLKNGFSLELIDGAVLESGATVFVGSALNVAVKWAISAFDDLKFQILDCKVTLDQNVVPLIKEKCYSKALMVQKVSKTSRRIEFAYQTFFIKDASDIEQVIDCTIKICSTAHPCESPPNDQSCPQDPDYGYSVDGYTAT